MIPCRLLGLCALVGGAVLMTTAFVSQDKGKDAKPASAPAGADDAEMMAKMAALGAPGPDHKVLEPLVGKWTAHVKMWMDPSGTPEESDGTAEVKSILGGRFFLENFKGTVMGGPFEGMGVMGFDNIKKKYVGSWCDTMCTGITMSEGTYDAAKKAFNYTSEGLDPTMSKYVPMRIVSTVPDSNSHKMEMYSSDKSGKEYRCMEITYTRAK